MRTQRGGRTRTVSARPHPSFAGGTIPDHAAITQTDQWMLDHRDHAARDERGIVKTSKNNERYATRHQTVNSTELH